ncbi:uncharacterized protein B0J16DRAFT_137517 [Fusarium flagelliforme]|uniref:uncharacterized protein n=1 Tax=Fusarium flagelliforme TaxID=2675880 RepID=UPI001E8E3C6D|nr:uncharacterized protein B0J16DRAFT_137517 [Fusarium flagelliforme]KAH7185619.1 hypothetical protein B0J16DRAFT_137517 [Fusarium flagelliforme]
MWLGFVLFAEAWMNSRANKICWQNSQSPHRNVAHIPSLRFKYVSEGTPLWCYSVVSARPLSCHLLLDEMEFCWKAVSSNSIPVRSSRHPYAIFGEGDAPTPRWLVA